MKTNESLEYLRDWITFNTEFPIILMDSKGKIIFFNKASEKVCGYSAKEVLGKDFSSFCLKKLSNKNLIDLLEHVAKKGRYHRDLILVRKNKTKFPAHFVVNALNNNKGKVLGFSCLLTDLSHKKDVYDELVTVRNLLETIFDSITDDLSVIDDKFRIVRANRAFLERTGKAHFRHIIGKSCWDALYNSKNKCKICPTIKTFKTGEPSVETQAFETKSGQIRYREIYTYPIKDNENKVTHVVHYTKDITHRQKLEQSLQKHNAELLFLQEIAESMHTVLRLNDLLHLILRNIMRLGYNRSAIYLVNKAKKRMEGVLSYGFKKNNVHEIHIPLEKQGQSIVSQIIEKKEPLLIDNLFDPNVKVYINEEMMRTLEGNSILVLPLIIEDDVIGMLTVDNRDKPLNVRENDLNTLMLFANSVAISINRAMLYDRLNHFNEQLQKKVNEATAEVTMKNIKLKELDQMKTEFIAIVSHELKTPLTSIKGYSSLLKLGKLGQLNPQQQQAIDILKQEAEKLTNLISNLINFSDLESGKTKLNIEEVDINAVIFSAIKDETARAKAKQINIHFDGKKNYLAKIDANLIERAIREVISNSIKYNKEKGRVDINVKDMKNKILIEITDSGVGIRKEKFGKLFEKFSQAEEHTVKQEGGIGVGLTIVKTILDKHHGEIKIKSKPSKGTTVSILIPKKVIIEKEARTESELKKTIAELRSIRKIFDVMHTEVDLKDILSLILQEIQKALGLDRIRLYLIDKKGKKLRGEMALGTPNFEGLEADVDKYKFIKNIMKSKQAEIVESPESPLGQISHKSEDATKFAIVPLVARGNAIGIITADNLYSKKEISEDDLKSLTVFASSASIAIENFRLYEQMEQRVERRTVQLENLNKQKDDFLSYASHELRTPLTSLLGYSKLLMSRKMNEAQKKDSINVIHHEATRLKNMLDNLLDLTKLEAKKVNLTLQSADIVDLANEITGIMKERANAKGISMAVDAEKIAKIKIDREKMEQVFMNLLSNAIKFTEKGSIVTIIKDSPKSVIVEVKDTGIGIDKKDYDKVFSKFEQIVNSVTKEKGTGLGMPIVKEIIELHKGKIWVESEPGKGSTFIFTIPKSI